MVKAATPSPAVEASLAGIKKWDEAMAAALGVQSEDLFRTSGCEVECRVTTENEKVFNNRLKALRKGKYQGYVKDAGTKFLPRSLRPGSWQQEHEQRSERNQLTSAFEKHMAKYTVEPTTYMAGVNTDRRVADPTSIQDQQHGDTHPQSYLTAEIVSKPIDSPIAAAQWLSNAGQHMIDTVEAKVEKLRGRHKSGHVFVDFRSKPSTTSWANSVHMHLGLKVALPALLDSPVFSPEQKAGMLERNVRFYREKLQSDGGVETNEIKVCEDIERLCSEKSDPRIILKTPAYADVIGKIKVNMFSRRELEGDIVTIDGEDVKAEEGRRAAGINVPRDIIVGNGEEVERRFFSKEDEMKRRYVGKDELSRFAIIFGRKLEEFNHDCALIIAPAKTSYQRFVTDGIDAPCFNAAGHRKTMNIFGAYLFRGEGRTVFGQHNSTGTPDIGDLRIENRILCSEAIGHPNHAYPNQRAMAYEVVEGMEYVFAKAAQEYAVHAQDYAADIVTESKLFDTYMRCLEGLPKGEYPDDIIPPGQRLPEHKAEALEHFEKKGGMAEAVYGSDRIAEMVERRAELDRIIYHDYSRFNEQPGPQTVHAKVKDVVVDPAYLTQHTDRMR
ncbi:MAG TPA: hypothetical protein VFT64_09700 [Rickettsiales bacterium]|nr:hypothetical protein [Rickettsiales bacterium]